MRILFFTITTVFVSVSIFAQGTVNFNNRVTGQVDAPVLRAFGVGAGPSMNAQLYLVSGAAYTPIGQATTFREPTATNPLLAAYVNPISSMIVDGSAPGSTITVVMRVWEGASYDGATLFGQSNPVIITLGGEIPGAPTAVPANLIGLQGIGIPEPSTIALGILGAAALLYRRRA